LSLGSLGISVFLTYHLLGVHGRLPKIVKSLSRVLIPTLFIVHTDKMSDFSTRLFARRWQPFHTNERELASSTKVEAFADPGVYLLAYTYKPMVGRPVRPADVFYVGMSNSAGGLRQRFRQFQSSLEGGNGHGPAYRFFMKCAKQRKYSQLRTKNRFFFAALAVPCESSKSKAKPRDFLLMGKVASLEYEAIARVLRSTGRLPWLNDLARDALDDVGA
jgi:hypothetical protein